MDLVQFALLGMASGALYGLVALGVVLVYRASGVLNFASAATGAAGAYVFYNLRDKHNVWWILALAAGILTGTVLGALTYYLVMRLLEHSSRLAKLVGTLGIMTSIQAAVVLTFGGDEELVKGFLPIRPVTIVKRVAIGEDRLILIGLVLLLTIGLRYVYKSTKFGLATSAVAENRRAAAALGTSVAKVEFVNFTVAGTLSSLASILLAPIVGLNVTILTLLVISALAAALVGGFSSFALTVAGAMGIGVLEAEMIRYVHMPGWGQSVPFGVIIVVIVAGGRARPSRGDLPSRLPMPGSGLVRPIPIIVAASIVGGGVFALTDAWADSVTTTILFAIIGLSVVVVTGYAGQLSLCQFALAGFGAWVAGRLVSAAGLPFWLGGVIGVVLTIPAGLLVALPALRTRGVNLAVATLGLSLAVESLIFNNAGLTGGDKGTVVGSPHLFGVDLDPIGHPARYSVLAIMTLAGLGILVSNVRRGRSGRRLLAVRSNERAAASLGVGVYGAKLYAFGLAAGIAAVGGVLIAFRNTYIVLSQFSVLPSIVAVSTAVIGGIGWASGAVVSGLFSGGSVLGKASATLVSTLHDWIPFFPKIAQDTVQRWVPLVAGVSVISVLRSAPNGLAAELAHHFHRPRRATGRARSVEVDTRRRERPSVTLDVRGISVRFGGVHALIDVSFSLESGEVLGVIGPNGAGKTTMLDALTGFVKPWSGTVLVNGESIDGWSPERRARQGVVRSFQSVELFAELTVRENLLVAADRQSPARYFIDLIRPKAQAPTALMMEMISDFGLEDVLDKHPQELSHGTARLVGIARAMVTEPAVLLLDEPASGLDSHERRELQGLITSVARKYNVGVVVIEHDVPLVLETCDRVLVLDFGQAIAVGTPDQVRVDPAVIAAYLGEPEADDEDENPGTDFEGLEVRQ